MRMLLVLAAFILSGSATAADSNSFQMRNAADLVGVCRTGPDDPNYASAAGFCHGVLVGAYQYYNSVVAGADRFVCAPNPTPTRAKVMNDFVAWAGANQRYMKDPPIDTLFRYLAEAYPCKK